MKKVVMNFNIGNINQKIIFIDENDSFVEYTVPLNLVSETIAKARPKEVTLVGPNQFLERFKDQIKEYSKSKYANKNINIEIKEKI